MHQKSYRREGMFLTIGHGPIHGPIKYSAGQNLTADKRANRRQTISKTHTLASLLLRMAEART